MGHPVIVKSALDNEEKKFSISNVDIALLLHVPEVDKLCNNFIIKLHLTCTFMYSMEIVITVSYKITSFTDNRKKVTR